MLHTINHSLHKEMRVWGKFGIASPKREERGRVVTYALLSKWEAA